MDKKEKNILFIVEGWGKKKNFELWKKNREISQNLNFSASGGHLLGIKGKKDGKRESLGINFKEFESYYSPLDKENIDEIRKKIKENDEIIVAFDCDSEGHVIAYHFVDYFKSELKGKDVYRATFPELTANEINRAIQRKIHFDDYDWKKFALLGLTRAFMDRVIGWTYSPMLTARLYNQYKGFSAGRVQTPALRLIYERQKLIDEHSTALFFNSNINYGDFQGSHIDNGKKEEIDGLTVNRNTKEDIQRIIEVTEGKNIDIPEKKGIKIEYEGKKEGKVKDFNEGQRSRNPYQPFSQDTLVGTLVGVLGCSIKDAKNATQLLYQNGFTTYPRGDTVQLGEEALISAHKLAKEKFPEDTLNEPLQYFDKGNAKVEAGHAACTPTTVWFEKDFDEVKKGLKQSGLKEDFYFNAYEVIWKRTVASQMKAAIYDFQKLTVNVQGEDYISKSEQCIYEGFLKVYNFDDEDEIQEENSEFKLEGYKKGDSIKIKNFEITSSESKPPAMYTEKSLIQALKKYGIGRPSTYNSGMITDSLIDKEYVLSKKTKEGLVLEGGKYQITDKGKDTIEVLNELEASIINYEYTSEMENEIDKIKEGEVSDKDVLKEFMKGVYEDIEKHGLEIDEDGFVNILKFDSRNHGTNKEVQYSEILDPHGNQKDQFLAIFGKDDKKYLKSVLTGASYGMNLRITDKECPECGNRICYDISQKGNEYGFCCSMKVKEGNEMGIRVCDHFESSKKEVNEDEIESLGKCNKCGEGNLFKKNTSKGDIVVCTKDCGFFNFLGNSYNLSDLCCEECGSKTIIKVVGSKGTKRRDCIQRTWNSQTKKNEGCSWDGEWYND